MHYRVTYSADPAALMASTWEEVATASKPSLLRCSSGRCSASCSNTPGSCDAANKLDSLQGVIADVYYPLCLL